jgi:hypothetical protein
VGTLHGPSIEQDTADDCSLCPICQAMAGAFQPLIPQLAHVEIGGLTLLTWRPMAAQRGMLPLSVLTDAVPRGPPAMA